MRAVTVMGLAPWTVGALLAGSIVSAPAQQSSVASPQLSPTRTAPSVQEAPNTNCDAYAAE
jgi:hypothetical protein